MWRNNREGQLLPETSGRGSQKCLEFLPITQSMKPASSPSKRRRPQTTSGQQPGPTKSISTTHSHRSSTRCSKMELERLCPSLWLIFAAFLLLFFSCLSGSAWSAISFLNVQIDGRDLSFGVFGYTGISQPTLGYNISQAIGPINQETDDYLSSAWVRGLEMALIIHLLVTILLFIAWAIMYWRRDVGKKAGLLRKVKIFFLILAAVGTFFLFLFDVSVFAALMNELRGNGIPADLGNANWITLGAVIALLIEPCWTLLERVLPKTWRRRPVATSGVGTRAPVVVGAA